MQPMEYHIISGPIIETRRSYMSIRPKQKRGTRRAGSSSLKKIKANEREAVKRLARILNCNWHSGLLFVTLKYSDTRLPKDYAGAQKTIEKLLRGLRSAGAGLRYVAVTANRSPKRQCPARLHHHLVLDPEMSMDLLRKLWPTGEIYVKAVREPGDLTGLAAYLLANVGELEPGKKAWSASKGLKKPIYTEPEPVSSVEGVVPLPETAVLDGELSRDEDGKIIGSYIRAIAEEAPRVRGSMVILPKRRGRRRTGTSGEALAETRRADE